MKKLVKESLNEATDYSNLERHDKLDLLEPLAVSIKGVLNRVDDFDPTFIEQLTDTWFAVNKEIGKASPGEMKKSVHESLNEGFATEEGRKLDRIAGWLGYDDLHEMLGDNPGLFEVCIEWIEQTFGEQLAEDLFQDGMNPEAVENVGLWSVASEMQERYDDEPAMDESSDDLSLSDIEHLAMKGRGLGPTRQDEIQVTWDIYNKNRRMIDKNFHVDFSDGDKPGSLVSIMEK
jgi:hypothetical protein